MGLPQPDAVAGSGRADRLSAARVARSVSDRAVPDFIAKAERGDRSTHNAGARPALAFVHPAHRAVHERGGRAVQCHRDRPASGETFLRVGQRAAARLRRWSAQVRIVPSEPTVVLSGESLPGGCPRRGRPRWCVGRDGFGSLCRCGSVFSADGVAVLLR